MSRSDLKYHIAAVIHTMTCHHQGGVCGYTSRDLAMAECVLDELHTARLVVHAVGEIQALHPKAIVVDRSGLAWQKFRDDVWHGAGIDCDLAVSSESLANLAPLTVMHEGHDPRPRLA